MRQGIHGPLRTTSQRDEAEVDPAAPGTFRQRAEAVRSEFTDRAQALTTARLEMQRRRIRWADARAWALSPDRGGQWKRSDCPERGLQPAVVEAYCVYLDAMSTEGEGT